MKRDGRVNFQSIFLLIAISITFCLFLLALTPAQNVRAQTGGQRVGGASLARRSPEEARAELARRGIKIFRYPEFFPAELRTAAIEGDLELVSLFLDAGISPNALSDKGYTALHYAACNDRFKVIDWLLERGADINAGDKDGESPLVMAASCGRIASIEYLLNKGANINDQGSDGATALLRAIAMTLNESDSTRKELVLRLLDRGADPHLAFETGFNSLMMAACAGDVDVVNALLERGVDVNAKDEDGETALLQALRCDHEDYPQAGSGALDAARILIARGADVEAKASDGVSAYELAKKRRAGDLTYALLDPQYKASLWTKIKYWCFRFNILQGWGGPAIYLLSVIISGIALKRQKPLKREKVEEGDGLPRLAPLKCAKCAAPIPISLTKNECPSCGAQARIPEDYTETLRLRSKAAETLMKAERVWKRASFYTQDWIIFLMLGVAIAWLAGSIFGFISEYASVRPVTIFVSTILGTVTFPLALFGTGAYLVEESKLFPKLPEVGRQIAQAEETDCKTCGAPARFEADHLVAQCSYCGSDLYRVALARRARVAASEEEEATAFSLYDAAEALQKRRRALFQTIEAVGSGLLLIIAITAVSLIVLAILIAVLALYLYATLS